jgi:two-component system alkaline phosphatase synthesis response regulator PhoP
LVIEDEPSLVMTLRDRLESEGFEVSTQSDGLAGLEAARNGAWEVLLLDISLPGMGGLDILKTLRDEGFGAPVLLLTARSQTVDKVVGLATGADDYLTKPFEMAELVARIDALLRRARSNTVAPPTASGQLAFGQISIDLDGVEVRRNDQPVELSQLEFKLLVHLVQRPGKVLSRDQLLSEVWGYDASVYSRTVDVHIASLRQKIEDIPSKPRHIVTVHGRGYKFVA